MILSWLKRLFCKHEWEVVPEPPKKKKLPATIELYDSKGNLLGSTVINPPFVANGVDQSVLIGKPIRSTWVLVGQEKLQVCIRIGGRIEIFASTQEGEVKTT